MSSQDENPVSSILGATGLSKRALASYFRQTGLFGRDSNLSREQQSAVFGRLPLIAGLRVPVVNMQASLQLQAIAELTSALIAGEDLSAMQARARAQGVRPQVISEICTVVTDAQLVFGPFARPAARLLPVTALGAALPEAA